MSENLSNRDIAMLLHIMQRTGLTGRIALALKLRPHVIPLWRRQLIEVWYRCAPDEGCMHGPYFSLTIEGHRLACVLLAARESRQHFARRPPQIAA